MEKLSLKHDIIEIEINDDGDTITIDPTDISLPLRIQKMYEDIQRIQSDTRAEALIIDKKEDRDGTFMTQNEKKKLELINRKYNEMRAVVDHVFGEGTCQKVFGSTNYVTMFNEFFDALNPVLENVGITAEKALDEIKAKYLKADSNEEEEL